MGSAEDGTYWRLDHEPGYLRIRTQEGGVDGTTQQPAQPADGARPAGGLPGDHKAGDQPRAKNFQYGGLMVYVDDDNYVQINRGLYHTSTAVR